MSRSLRYLFGALVVLSMLLVGVLHWLNDGGEDVRVDPVLALPAGYDPAPANRPAYSGPHPASIGRPVDPFVYPIAPGATGPVQSLATRERQYPFVCRSEESGLGQPLIDNQMGAGVAVYERDASGAKTQQVLGYSKDCSLATAITLYYKRANADGFALLSDANDDIARITVDGVARDFIVRVETGTINRFIYVLAVLADAVDTDAQPRGDYWNRNLIYQLRGGVGIGHRQGRATPADLLSRREDQLAAGYAIAYSSGNQTSNHYNMWLAEDTLRRVKSQFVARYGSPRYTIGVGASGGGLSQYLIAQNRPGLLDAAVALYSYPDMVTQTTYGLDCELLEYYFDEGATDTRPWRDWSRRKLVEGMNSSADAANQFTRVYALSQLINARWPRMRAGNSACVNGWRGLGPIVNNPRYVHFADRIAAELVSRVNWSFWDDLVDIYGSDADGHARRTFDNVGVQYGLQALRDGELSLTRFVDLNARVGGWKPPSGQRAPRYWRRTGARSTLAEASPWGRHNMRLAGPDGVAPRSVGDPAAIAAAYRSGQVFLGDVSLPIIDLRHYLEDELDMHHLRASFATRARIERARGNARNQLIWVTAKPHSALARALLVLEEWLARAEDREPADVRPAAARDACFDRDGNVIAHGDDVWTANSGRCAKVYPAYSTSRGVAGEPLSGDVLKCALQSIGQAIERGVYGAVDVSGVRAELERIFPSGVCDYSRPGVGQPD